MAQQSADFDHIQVGNEYSFKYKLTPELVEDYIKASGDRNSWYTGASPFGGPIAPLVLVPRMHASSASEGYSASGRVQTSTNSQFFAPAKVGTTITVSEKVIERYIKRGREYVDRQFESRDENGVLICREVRSSLVHYAKVEEGRK